MKNASTLLQQGVRHAFVQLSQSLSQLNNEQYTRPSVILFNATIGQHVRHIIELFTCLETGYETGVVNYEKRKRDHLIENDKELASILCNGFTHILTDPIRTCYFNRVLTSIRAKLLSQ